MFQLHFDTSNEAFSDSPAREAARILRKVARRLESGETDGRIRDVNGNTVGRFDLTEEEG